MVIFFLYILQKSLNTDNDKEIKEALLEAVHQIIKESKPFFMHESFFEKRGGFDLQINGVHIYKVIFSCLEAAYLVQMSVSLSVCPSGCKIISR